MKAPHRPTTMLSKMAAGVTLLTATTEARRELVATFDDVVQGTITLVDLGKKGVKIYTDVKYKDSAMEPTTGHNWHVHNRGDLYDEGVKTCGNPGAEYHYIHPREQVDGEWKDISYACTDKKNFKDCYVGDLGNKIGKISLGAESFEVSGVDTSDLKDWVDTCTSAEKECKPNIKDWGARRGNYFDEIINRSIVIHVKDGGGGRLDCARLKLFDDSPKPMQLVATFDQDDNVLTGTITFTETRKGVEVKTNLKYKDPDQAATNNHNWHIHNRGDVHDQGPAGGSGTKDCGSRALTTGAEYHYIHPQELIDGAWVDISYPCTDKKKQKDCYVSDMSGKF